MSKPTSIKIDDVEYVRKDSMKAPLQIGEKRIIVADRGWVFVGDCVDNPNGSVTIHNAQNIRVWGTSKGLGQLATGKTSQTVLDDYGTVSVVPIVTIAVQSGW
jgi:hypothetical protein